MTSAEPSRFTYFRDPMNFAYRIDGVAPCSTCAAEGTWLDARGFAGTGQIECICDDCLASGRLIDLEIETNDATEGTAAQIEDIVHRTPSLPTWQDHPWPYVDGGYCTFERMASKADFDGSEQFRATFTEQDRDIADMDWLWNALPEARIQHYGEGPDVCVYLFTRGTAKHCLWDAS